MRSYNIPRRGATSNVLCCCIAARCTKSECLTTCSHPSRTADRYTTAAIFFHWIIFLLVALAYLAIFGSVIGFTAYLMLVGRIGPERAAYCTVLFPIVALAAWRLGPLTIAGVEGWRWVILLGASERLEGAGGAPVLSILRGTGSTLTSYVKENSPAGEGNAPQKAYAAAFVLLVIVVVLNAIVTRLSGGQDQAGGPR